MTHSLRRQEPESKLRQIWLARYLAVESKMMPTIRGILTDAAQDAFKSILALEKKSGIGAEVRIGQYGSIMKIVRDIDDTIFKQMKPVIIEGQQLSAEAAVDALGEQEKSILNRLFRGRGGPEAVENWLISQRNSAALGVNHAINRQLRSSIPLSRRVYRSRSLSDGYVERAVNSAIVSGTSARDLAKRVREHINPDVAGGVSYAAMRLGRTEFNNAFHATSIQLMEDQPWVDFAKWHLSKVHVEKTGCKCEEYAQQGLFTIQSIPKKPHPQCRCFVTAELPDWETFERNLLIGMYDSALELR